MERKPYQNSGFCEIEKGKSYFFSHQEPGKKMGKINKKSKNENNCLYKKYFAYKRSFAERYGALVGTMGKPVFDSIYTYLHIMVL